MVTVHPWCCPRRRTDTRFTRDPTLLPPRPFMSQGGGFTQTARELQGVIANADVNVFMLGMGTVVAMTLMITFLCACGGCIAGWTCGRRQRTPRLARLRADEMVRRVETLCQGSNGGKLHLMSGGCKYAGGGALKEMCKNCMRTLRDGFG